MIQDGCFGAEAVLTALGFSAPQAARSSAARPRDLPRTRRLRAAALLCELLRVGLEPLDVVELVEHVALVGERVGLVDHVVRLAVVAGVLVGEAEVPVSLGDLCRLELGILLRVLRGAVERVLCLLPVAALGPADAALELR